MLRTCELCPPLPLSNTNAAHDCSALLVNPNQDTTYFLFKCCERHLKKNVALPTITRINVKDSPLTVDDVCSDEESSREKSPRRRPSEMKVSPGEGQTFGVHALGKAALYCSFSKSEILTLSFRDRDTNEYRRTERNPGSPLFRSHCPFQQARLHGAEPP